MEDRAEAFICLKSRAIWSSSAYLGIVSHCKVQRRIAVRILVVDLRAAVETELDELFVAVLCSDEQERVALLVRLVDWKICVERVLYALRLAAPSLHKDGRNVGHSTLARPLLNRLLLVDHSSFLHLLQVVERSQLVASQEYLLDVQLVLHTKNLETSVQRSKRKRIEKVWVSIKTVEANLFVWCSNNVQW